MTVPELAGRRIMVVEDEALIAAVIEDILVAAGAVVVGPYPSVKAAMAALDERPALDGALLDINLQGKPVLPVAERLVALRTPIVFLTGFGASALPASLADRPVVTKPYRDETLLAALVAAVADRPPVTAEPAAL